MTKNPSPFIFTNEACCICGVKSDIVCQECLAFGQLGCFCDKHKERHKMERFHQAYWGVLYND